MLNRVGFLMRTRDRSTNKLFYSIGEVCELLGLEAHVLRYWESEFRLLKPSKNRSGKRAYKEKDIRILRLIKYLVYDEGYTIEGADRKLKKMLRPKTSGSQTEISFDPPSSIDVLREISQELVDIRALLDYPPAEEEKRPKTPATTPADQ